MSEELRVLVPYKEYALLKKIEKEHMQNCKAKLPKNQNSTDNPIAKIGTGTVFKSGDQLCRNHEDIGSHVMSHTTFEPKKNTDQSIDTISKDVIVETAPNVESKSAKNLSNIDIVNHLKQDFQEYGRIVLELLSAHPDQFQYDNNGVVKINNNFIPGSSVFELLPVTFYSLPGKENITGIETWLNLLQKNNLKSFVKNIDLLPNTHKKEKIGSDWFFLGSL